MVALISGNNGVVNCFMSYGRRQNIFGFKARCRGVSRSYDVIASESHARQTRGFYPHQRAEAPFTVTLELKGNTEYENFMQFMELYIKSFMNLANNAMYISVPARKFDRIGVPVSGVSHGDHVGSNLFTPTIAFQAILDPLDTAVVTQGSASTPGLSSWFSSPDSDGPGSPTNFFYPVSAASNNPNLRDGDLYDLAPNRVPDFVPDIRNNHPM